MPLTPSGRWPKSAVASRTAAKKYRALTKFLRVPAEDWAAVTTGHKTEFRLVRKAPPPDLIKTPTPVVAYLSTNSEADTRLMLLEDSWMMPVGMISEESLAREGFPDLAHFRRYWMQRTNQHFDPMQNVAVYRVRPVTPDDYDYLGRLLLADLYRGHLE